ncbi:MAG: hypothetical protein ACK4SA_20015, partial [Caldilinea sp.]
MLRKIVSLFLLAALVLTACSPAAPAEPAAGQPAADQSAAAACTKPVTIDLYMVGGGDTPARPDVEAALNAYIEPLICANVRFNIVGWGDWFSKAITG